MKTKEQVEKEFRADLTAVFEKWSSFSPVGVAFRADLEIEQKHESSAPKLSVYIPSRYDEEAKELLWEATDIDLGTHFDERDV